MLVRLAPLAPVRIDVVPLGKLRWQIAPLATRAQQVQHCTEHFVQILLDWFGAAPNAAQQRLYLGKLLSADVAWVRLSFHITIVEEKIVNTFLELILEGEPPYDIFVRWKPLAQQPIGWNPDLNDGVRLNIRPFMTAEVLRHNKKPKLNIAWDKDRGKDVESAPWFGVFGGDRINDHHLTLAQKLAAR